ncbi:MAG TPA: hypothetical protein DCY13_13560 [Verrucomicrobiales bacterium]|nr:hypothetical protein [Verrucomicrobiales bacterium]
MPVGLEVWQDSIAPPAGQGYPVATMRLSKPASALLIASLLTVFLHPPQTPGAAPASPARTKEERKRPPTSRELREAKRPRPAAPEPIVVDGVLQSAMGYPRIFVRLHANGALMVGQPAPDVVQRARALRGDWTDLNLASSQGVQSWWTAVLDTGATTYSVNQETAARFLLKPGGDSIVLNTGIDGESVKTRSMIYSLSIAGSHGRVSEQPSMPFVPVEDTARFVLETTAYRPQYRLRPDGANLIGMLGIRHFTIEIDSSNVTLEQLAKPLDLSSPEGFEGSLHNLVAGPRVVIRPPAFRPTNDVVRLPLRYVDSGQLNTPRATAAPHPAGITPMVMGVRTSEGERRFVGNFVFDTGSPVTMISRWHAYQLGLIPHADRIYDQPEYEAALRGTSNRNIDGSGFIIDSLEVVNPAGQIIKWRNVPVVVHDVAERQYTGGFYIHDGIIGNNLLLPTTDGSFSAGGLNVSPAPFEKWWVHGPSGELWLQRPGTNAAPVEAAASSSPGQP